MSIRFYTQESLGKTQHLTPDGFLLCEDVPIARVGMLTYARGEVPIQAGNDGLIYIQREPQDVFHDHAVNSFAGKPVTDDHPPERVGPENWKQYSIGVTLHPRRGDGIKTDSNYLYADLLIQDHAAIRAVREGKRQVSAGYDANYEQIAPGRGKQTAIIGNHVALVDRGRCGPRCAIGDHEMPGSRLLSNFKTRVMRAVRTGDEEAVEKELDKIPEMLGEVSTDGIDDMDDGAAHHHITVNVNGRGAPDSTASDPTDTGSPDSPVMPSDDPDMGGAPDPSAGGGNVESMLAELSQRMDTIEQAIAVLAQGDDDGDGDDDSDADNDDDADADTPTSDPPTDEPAKPATKDKQRARVGDSSSLSPKFSDMLSRAEILSPGCGVPTFDSKRSARMTVDAMCDFRRGVLKDAWRRPETRQALERLSGGTPDFRGMTCDAAELLFNGAAEIVRQKNNKLSFAHNSRNLSAGVAISPSEINRRNRELYK